ncbi:MAG: transposase [Nanoarchaeota archaeon]|nr:transposase [Nanoarchaeota archaeon]
MALMWSLFKVFKIKYHLVFHVKYRKDLFVDDKYIITIKQICKDLEYRFFLLFETIGFDEDNVHFLEKGLSTTYSLRNFSDCEKYQCREIFKRHSE